MKISIIAAISMNGVVGNGNKLPWYYPDDLAYFKKITKGKTVLMGRKTFESIGHVLPERKNIIVSKQSSLVIPKAHVFTSLDKALVWLDTINDDELFVIGGPEIWRFFLEKNLVDYLYLTIIKKKYEGDVHFPAFELAKFRKVQETYPSDNKDLVFLKFEKV